MSQVLGTFAPKERQFHKSESSKELNVLSVDFSLPGTKVQRNEKAWIHVELSQQV